MERTRNGECKCSQPRRLLLLLSLLLGCWGWFAIPESSAQLDGESQLGSMCVTEQPTAWSPILPPRETQGQRNLLAWRLNSIIDAAGVLGAITVNPPGTWGPDGIGGEPESSEAQMQPYHPAPHLSAPPHLPACKRLSHPLTYSCGRILVGHLLCACPSSNHRDAAMKKIQHLNTWGACILLGG